MRRKQSTETEFAKLGLSSVTWKRGWGKHEFSIHFLYSDDTMKLIARRRILHFIFLELWTVVEHILRRFWFLSGRVQSILYFCLNFCIFHVTTVSNLRQGKYNKDNRVPWFWAGSMDFSKLANSLRLVTEVEGVEEET